MSNTHHVTGNVKQAGAVAGRPVYVHDAATGILLASGTSNPVTGDYDIGLTSDDPVYVTVDPSPGFLPGMAGEVVPIAI